MDSPAFYDTEVEVTKTKNANSVFLFDEPLLAEYGELYQNEGSIDLTSYLDPGASSTVKSDDLFRELGFPPTSTVNDPPNSEGTLPELIKVNHPKPECSTEDTGYMPQIGRARNSETDESENQRQIVVKTEKVELDTSGHCCQENNGKPYESASQTTSTVPGTRNQLKSAPPGKAIVKGKRLIDKESDEYRQRRQRNNVAVRKSREKTKQKQQETQQKVSQLQEENERLQKKVELLSKELTVLKTLFTNVGVAAPVFNGADAM
ncbi:CCAAT/enhancer-binding protein epsilon-like [Ptychodera flava]|uniref:CCAAT/enhancer-binding protein epsilon-like n=1 Tax=Ptychodera flava TaxID=63121 RepID=UPI00396A371F